MSREQANSFKKHRDAEDPQGNLTWAARFSQKAMRAGPEALARLDVETEFELTDAEKILWRLVKLPRKYVDLEHTGVLSVEKCRGFFRGLVAADVVDIVDGTEAKALLPAEVKRLKAEIAGKEIVRGGPLRAKVYRPDIDGPPPAAPEPAVPAAVVEVEVAPSPSRPVTAPRGIPAPVALEGEARIFSDEIDRAFTAMPRQNHFEFMGLARGVEDAAVRQAYVRLAREYHPDKVASGGFNASIREKVDVLFKRLGEANDLLGTAEKRASYERTLDALGENKNNFHSGKNARRPMEANNAYKMAETYFKKKELKQAEAHYRQAATFNPEDPRILTALAFCIWLNPDHDEKQRSAEAKKRLGEVITNHRYADAAYKLGLIHRKDHDESAAQRQFALAHKIDSAHTDAQREVRLAESRHKKAQDEKNTGLLGKFLKK